MSSVICDFGYEQLSCEMSENLLASMSMQACYRFVFALFVIIADG